MDIYSKRTRPKFEGTGPGPEPGLTKQEFKEECDINCLMERYAGVPPPGARAGLYGDFSTVGDFQEAQERYLSALAQFEALPSKVRERFANNPAALLAAVDLSSADESVRVELQELGVLNKPAPPPAPPAEPPVVVPPGTVKVETVKTS